MLLKDMTIEQMWAFVYEDASGELLGVEVVCNGCGCKENMAVILTLAPHRDRCFKCDAEWLDRELEGWC